MKKRTLALILALVLVFGAAVGGTIAYLTDTTDPVTNTFTVGKVDITLDEAKVDAYGVADTTADRVKANSYKLIPGHTYTKDPTIHVATGSEDCWLFVKIENGLGTAATLTMGTGWTEIDSTNHVWAYNTKVSAGADVTVFSQFTFSEDVTATQLPTYNGKTIVVTACAVQADGLDQTAAAAQAKFSA